MYEFERLVVIELVRVAGSVSINQLGYAYDTLVYNLSGRQLACVAVSVRMHGKVNLSKAVHSTKSDNSPSQQLLSFNGYIVFVMLETCIAAM